MPHARGNHLNRSNYPHSKQHIKQQQAKQQQPAGTPARAI
jgi:hypothetical protein